MKKKIEEALKQLKNEEEKVNATDTEAKIIRNKQQINLNYNCHAGITEDLVIVSPFTTNNASDKRQLLPNIQQAEHNTSIYLQRYFSRQRLRLLRQLRSVGSHAENSLCSRPDKRT